MAATTIVGALPATTQDAIKNAKVLLVGAGGIGCEVLKNLVMTGFGEIDVVDLDTIDVSNLNRQFLFDKESVGKAKSHVARESVLKFNPNVTINSHMGDIMSQAYGGNFFTKFNLIINALDNKKARNHVNRMCLSHNLILIESGTLGYSGQVELIKKGLTECYECVPKPEPKSYPMCTIRNTPTEPIHCIIWAKFLFSQLFGEIEEDVSMEEEITQDTVPAKVSAREWAKINNYNSRKLCCKFFIDDINYLLSMPDLFKKKNFIRPVVLDESFINQRAEYAHEPLNKVLGVAQYVTMFLDCVAAIYKRLTKSSLGSLIWDKDDDDLMQFVVACSNIRSELFHIPLKSYFDIKSMAGNIIPAIATANAIIGGQIVIHALRALEGNYERCQSNFLRQFPNSKGVLLVKDKLLIKPNPKCSACSTDGEIVLSTDINLFTLKQFEELVLKSKLNMIQPDVIFDGKILISSDEDDEIDTNKTLADMGVQNGSRFSADDYHQNYSVKIVLYHKDKTNEENPDFLIFGNVEDLIKMYKKSEEPDQNDSAEDDADCLIEPLPKFGNEENIQELSQKIKTVSEVAIDNDLKEDEISNDDLGLKPTCNTNEDNIIDDDHNNEDILIKPLLTSDGNDGNNDEIIQENEMVSEETTDDHLMEDVNNEISNEEKLAIKRKADDSEDISESKKSRAEDE